MGFISKCTLKNPDGVLYTTAFDKADALKPILSDLYFRSKYMYRCWS